MKCNSNSSIQNHKKLAMLYEALQNVSYKGKTNNRNQIPNYWLPKTSHAKLFFQTFHSSWTSFMKKISSAYNTRPGNIRMELSE